MTVPRGEIFNPKEIGVYHCISRCVRRAFLCGFDAVTGQSFEHRRTWMRERLTFLLSVFSIELLAYALMSNHLHTLLKNRPDIAASWSPEEVARRWLTLFPKLYKSKRGKDETPSGPTEEEILAITSNRERVETYRERLCSLSWFMRCLSEYMARRSNREDECTGRFWEGRFKSQRVHGIGGVLACGVYIDLNPIRAEIASTPEDSDFTSIQDRTRALRASEQKRRLLSLITPPLVSIEEATEGRLSTVQYLQLVDETGRISRAGKGKISDATADILTRLGVRADTWIDTATNVRRAFKRTIGPVESLKAFATKIGKRWLHGYGAARRAFV
jgi:hypothetical protein